MAQRTIGELVVKIRGDSSELNVAVDSAKQKTTGMTASVLKAQVAFQLLQQGVRLLTGFVKNSIAEFTQAEQVMAKTRAVIASTGGAAGLTSNEVKKMAGEFQRLTTFGDEEIQSAQNLILTFTNIKKDIFPQTTETILDMSAALGQDLKSSAMQLGKALQDPILGVTALRRVGVNFNEAQTETIKNLVRTGKLHEAQSMILKELQVEFGGTAKAMRNTFGGAVTALQNAFSDLQENLGQFIQLIAKPIIEFLTDIIDKINEFLETEEGFRTMSTVIATIAGVFSVMWEIVKTLFDYIGKAIDIAIKPLIKVFEELFPKGTEASVVFQILAGVLKVVSIGLTIVAKVIAIVIQLLVDLIATIRDSVELVASFAAAMVDPFNTAKWDEVGKQAQRLGKEFVDLHLHVINGIGDLISSTVKQFEELITDADGNAKKLEDAFTNTYKNIMSEAEKLRAAQDDPAKNPLHPQNTEEQSSDFKTRWQKAFEETGNNFKSALLIMKEEMDKYEGFNSEIMGRISSIINQASQNALDNAQNEYGRKKQWIEKNITDETKKTAELAKLEEEYAKKQLKLKQEAFIANKIVNVLNSLSNTAVAVTNALANIPAPYCFIVAGIIGALGAAQTALIAAQPVPEFAKGGVAYATPGGQMVRVAEAGVNEYMVPDKANIWNSIADRISANMGNTNNYNTVNNNLPGKMTLSIDGKEFYTSLSDASRNGKFIIDKQHGIGRRS